MAKPLLSVIVCTYNRQDLLPICLKSLSNQTIDKSLYEVIVVDNNSTDSTNEISQEFVKKNTNFRVVVEPQIGLCRARNRGWTESKGDYVAYIDDDAKASSDWCGKIIDAFEKVTPKPVVVGGEIHPWYETRPPDWFMDDFETRSWGDRAKFIENKYGFSGSNMAFQTRLFDVYGGFPTDVGMIGRELKLGDEANLFRRIYEKEPYMWYDPKILVYHWVPTKNMTVRYRLYRKYKIGEASVFLRERKVFSVEYLKKWGCFIFMLIKSPYIILKDRNKTSTVITLGELANRIGFLIGRP